MTRTAQRMAAMFHLPIQDALFFAVGTGIYRFCGTSTYGSLVWRSKHFVFKKPVNFGALYIRCSGALGIILYANNTDYYYTVSVTGTGYYRLPAGKKCLSWGFTIGGAQIVDELVFAETMGELRSV